MLEVSFALINVNGFIRASTFPAFASSAQGLFPPRLPDPILAAALREAPEQHDEARLQVEDHLVAGSARLCALAEDRRAQRVGLLLYSSLILVMGNLFNYDNVQIPCSQIVSSQFFTLISIKFS